MEGKIFGKEKNKTESIYKEYASKIAEEIDTPVILVGVNRSYNNMNDILNNSKIEYFQCLDLL